MGNSLACFCCAGGASVGVGGAKSRRLHVALAALPSDPAYNEGPGHSFCYVRPDKLPPTHCYYSAADDADLLVPDAKAAAFEEAITFRAISGAALSANVSTPLSTCCLMTPPPPQGSRAPSPSPPSRCSRSPGSSPAPSPLRPSPGASSPGPSSGGSSRVPSTPHSSSAPASSPPGGGGGVVPALRRSLSHGGRRIHDFTCALLARTDWFQGHPNLGSPDAAAAIAACGGDSNGLQWAQGKAGKDRVHVVVSEEHRWVLVGIYDGFNGPDATDFLVSNLYTAVHRELRSLLWECDQEDQPGSAPNTMAPDHQDQWTR